MEAYDPTGTVSYDPETGVRHWIHADPGTGKLTLVREDPDPQIEVVKDFCASFRAVIDDRKAIKDDGLPLYMIPPWLLTKWIAEDDFDARLPHNQPEVAKRIERDYPAFKLTNTRISR